MADQLEDITVDQEDPQVPPLPKGYEPIKKNGNIPPLPAGYEPLKKKEGGALPSTGQLKSPDQAILDYVSKVQSKNIAPEQESHAKVLTQIPIEKLRNQPLLAEPTEEKVLTNAHKKLFEIAYGEGDKWKDPLKAIQEEQSQNPKNLVTNVATQELATNSIAPDGYEANKLLALSRWGKEGGDNVTANFIKDKAKKYNDVVDGLRNVTDFDPKASVRDAAVLAFAKTNPQFAKELQAAGISLDDPMLADKIPSGKMGQITEAFVNDPNVSAYLKKENPNLAPIVEDVAKNNLQDNPDYAINQVANEVSQARTKLGLNAAIVNFYGKDAEEATNKVAEELYKDNPEKLAIYNSAIRNNQGDYIDAPSLLSRVASGIKGGFAGIGNTLMQPFTSEKKSVLDKWEKDASHVSADPQGFLKFTSDAGNVLGFIMSLEATAGTTGIGSLNALTAATTGDIIQEAREKYRGEPVKAAASATMNALLYRALGKDIFPGEKAKAAFEEVRPQMDKIAESLTNGVITKEAARREAQNVYSKAIDFATGTLTKDVKIAGELTGISLLNRGLDKVMMDKQTFQENHPDSEIPDSFEHNFLSNIVLAGLGKYGEMKNANNVVAESLYNAASNPKQAERLIDSESTKASFGDANEMKDNLDYISRLKESLDAGGIDEKNQKRFIFEALQEKAKRELNQPTGNAVIDRKQEEDLKTHQDIQEKILSGEDVQKKEKTEPTWQNQLDEAAAKEKPLPEDLLSKEEEKAPEERIVNDSIEAAKDIPSEAWRNAFLENPKESLRQIAQQVHSSESEKSGAINTFTKKITDLATELYPTKESTLEQPQPEKALTEEEIKAPSENEIIQTTTEVPEQIPPSEKTPTEQPTIEVGKGAKKSVLERPIEEITIDDILKEMQGDEGLAFKDISNKDIKDGDGKNIEAYNQRAERVLKALYPEAEFKALNTTKEYEQATGRKGEAGVLVRGKEGKHQLFLNLEAIKNSNIERTATHEVIHALVSDAIGVKYADLRKKWDNLLPKLYNVKGFDVIKEHISNYPSADRPVEGITDLLANIVHNKIKIEDVPKNLWDDFIELINRAFQAIGIDYKITPDTFNGFAQSVKEAFDTGDFRDLKKFTSKGKTEKFFKEYPELAEASAMIDPAKRKQLEDLLRKKIEAEIKSGKLTDEDAKKIFEKAGIGEPPKGEGEEVVVSLPEKMVGIKHDATKSIRSRYNLPEYERSNKTNTELEAEADAAIKEGYNVEKLIKKVEEGTPPTGVENIILTKYIGALDAEFESTRSDVTLKEIQRVLNATDKIGSLQSEAFRTRKTLAPSDDSLASFFLREMDAMGVGELTDVQKTKIQKEWDDIEKAKNEYNAYVFQKESELAGREIAAKIAAESKAGTRVRKTDKEFSEERKQIITDIKEKLRKARGETSATILPYAKELVAISPDVAKLVKNLVQQGVVKIEEVIDKVHEILVEDIKDITKDDVRDLVAGKYQEKKQTRNQLAKTLYELRQEAKLLSQLDDALKGKPKTEKAKIQRNQRLEQIRKQIKDVQDFYREVEAQKLAKTELAAKEKTATEKELTKAEKELAKKTPEQKAIETTKTRLLKEIEKIEGQIKKGDFAKEEKKEPLKLDEEGKKLKDKLIKLRTEREVRIMKEQYENRNKYEKARDFVIDKLNVPRTIMASMDYSAPFRQGLVAGISHPRTAVKSFGAMFKASLSQRNFDRWVHDNRESPRFEIQNKSGLAVTDPHSPFLAAKEEQFMNNTAEKIPLFGRLIKGSERAYVMYLNKMRVDLFNRFADRFEEQGKTFENSPQLYKAMANLINNETGRGNLGKIESAAPVLNTVFFSPRLIASRVNLLTNWANPLWYKNTPKEVRIMYMKDMLKFIGLGTSVLALMKYGVAGSKDDKDKVTVETDPRSSDFGKIKSGNTRWDIWGGFQQYVRLVTQLALGEKKSAGTGEIQELDSKGRFGESRTDVLSRFVRGKLAPVPSMAVDIFQGRNVQGQEVSTQQELIQHLTPLIYSDVQQAMQDKGVSSLFTVGVPSIFGVGVQTYQPSTTTPKTFKIYQSNGNKVREATEEEMKKVRNDANNILEQELKNAENNKGWGFNRYGEITISNNEIKEKGDYKKLSDENKKILNSRLKTSATERAKDRIKF